MRLIRNSVLRYHVRVMTLHKLSAGDGYAYYTNEVASADQLRDRDRELGDYYTVEGLPPGQWVGSGVADLELSGEVREDQMRALFGDNERPMNPEQLRTAFGAAQDRYSAAYQSTLTDYHRTRAEVAWKVLSLHRTGSSQREIAKTLAADVEWDGPKTHRSIGRLIASYREAGNDVTRLPDGAQMPTRDEFIAGFKLSPERKDESLKRAEAAGQAASREWLDTFKLGGKPRAYQQPDNEFTKRLAEALARHERTTGTAPTKDERRKIRGRVGGQVFREMHGRDAKSSEELGRFMTAQTTAKQQAVAGFDLVFTPTKSVSLAWGLGDTELRKGIEKAHENAIRDVVTYLEDNALYTRRGHNGVRQVDVAADGGIIATKFRHYDSREGDPNLHDHLVIANKVKGPDGRYTSLDGRMFYQHNVAASELYNSRVMEHIRSETGLEFTGRERRGKMVYELAGFSDETPAAFSSRRVAITAAIEEAEAEFIREHGYAPNAKQRIALAQQATLATRPTKNGPVSLEALGKQWAEKAATVVPDLPLGTELHEHLKTASTDRAEDVALRAAELHAAPAAEHALNLLERLEESRSTWRLSNVEAEAQRYFRETGNGTAVDPELYEATVRSVANASITITPSKTVPVPEDLRRKDGRSVYEVAGSQIYTSEGIIACESRILDAAATEHTTPLVDLEKFATTLAAYEGKADATQVAMARHFATSDKLLAVGVGPAGAGKTTSTKLLVQAVEDNGHRVIGVAPTAAAAAVMSQEMGIQAMTVDKLIHPNTRLRPRQGDMILVDEIGMVSTPKLTTLVDLAEANGAVVRGIGDYRQLAAVGSGGALRLIDREVGAVHLEDLYRFRNPDGTRNEAEADASLALREPPLHGADEPFQWYKDNGRVQAGASEVMTEEVFAAWSADTAAGKQSIMIASTNAEVLELNRLAQAQAASNGRLDPEATFVNAQGVTIHVGDRVVTRMNNRELSVHRGKDFVKNGDLWDVVGLDANGLHLVHAEHGGRVDAPVDYAAANLELGYASTIHRAQGSTVDTVHALVGPTTDRNGAYVALSRGRESNNIYVATTETTTRDEVLETIAAAYDRDLSVHETVEQARATDRAVAPRIAVYNDLAEEARNAAMHTVATEALGSTRAAALTQEPAWAALAHELAATQQAGHDPVATLRQAHEQRALAGAEDQAAVLHWRIQGLRERDTELREATGPRPFAAIPDDHLDALTRRADAATAAANQPVDPTTLEDPAWFTRRWGMTPTDELNQRRADLATTITAGTGTTNHSWDLEAIDGELSRRRWSSETQRQTEEICRGERPRTNAHEPIATALHQEQQLRASLLPTDTTPRPPINPERVRHGVSGHTVDTTWATDPRTPPRWREVLEAHHKDIGDLTTLRGKDLAANPPEWAHALGPVPANPATAARWHRVAGEVDAFRATYRIPDSETTPIPAAYQESETGAWLSRQVVDVHKRGATAHRAPSPTDTVQQTAEQATTARDRKENTTEAERIIARDRTRRTDPEKIPRNPFVDAVLTQRDPSTQSQEKTMTDQSPQKNAQQSLQQLRDKQARKYGAKTTKKAEKAEKQAQTARRTAQQASRDAVDRGRSR